MWSKVIYNTENQLFQETTPDSDNYFESFTYPIAEGLYTDLQQAGKQTGLTENLSEDFNSLTNGEKSFWNDYASEIPDKLKRLNLFIRPFEEFCRTCIITDKEISTLVQIDLERYCK